MRSLDAITASGHITTPEYRYYYGADPSHHPREAAQDAIAPASTLVSDRPGPRPAPGSPPQAILYHAAVLRWGDAVAQDYAGAVPGRKYEIDIALPARRLGLEVDGYRSHGRDKKGWQRDLEKDRLLLLNHWLVLRVSAKDAAQHPQVCLDWLQQCAMRWGLWRD